MIDNIGQDQPDTWTAEVSGSSLYSVEIKLESDEIVSWNCNCPYDYGDICKHVVAVLLYIKNNKDRHPAPAKIPHSPQQEQLTEILKLTNHKELTAFLSQYADTHPDFYQALSSSLHPQKKRKAPVDYEKAIQKCFHVKNAYDMPDYPYKGKAIFYKLNGYIENAKSLLKLNCKEEALTILLCIVKKAEDNYEKYEDYDDELGSVCREVWRTIVEMIESGLPDNLLKILMDEINRMIEEALKNNPNASRTHSLVISKIEFLKSAHKKEEVEKVMTNYLHIPAIREIKLTELLSTKQYPQALALLDEGISLAEKQGLSGIVSDWKDQKLSVYQLTDNREKVIELAEDLFVNGRERMKYYHILKTVIPSGQWATYLDDFLLKSGKQKTGGIGGHVFAQIYIKEACWDRLMDYVEKNIRLGIYCSLEEYESHLRSRYPARMLAFYRSQIMDYAAKNMGRDYYKYIADVLKTMKEYPGGTEMVNSLVAHFKSIYPNRRMMIEELEK
ncbi:MAG: SWIM zinc finger family protein [Prevotellaceae bacterium]|jgi:tetratricopeptide (TPR) repeat protein|nr:SWIM zinc finger family protein [Prevotellaceae bacterium]